MRRLRIAFAIFFAIAIVGCNSPRAPNGASGTQTSVGESPSAGVDASANPVTTDVNAQEAFKQVLDGYVEVARTAGESEFSFAMRNLDAELHRFREAGLAFWQDHPDDPRRLEWLEMTVNAPPSYAADPFQWVAANENLGPDKYAIDRAALSEWNRVYQELRTEFWNAPEVTEQQRRSIWSAELRQQMLELRRASREERRAFDVDSYLAQIQEFSLRFDAPVDEGSETYYWDFGVFLRLALGRQDTLGLDHVARRQFAEKLASLDSEAAQMFGKDVLARNGHFTFHSFYSAHKRYENLIEAEDLHRVFSATDLSETVLDAMHYAIPLYPGLHQGRTEAGDATSLFADTYRDGLRFLHMGNLYWNSMTQEERLHWVQRAHYQGRPFFFPENLSSYLWTSHKEGTADLTLDADSLHHWSAVVERRANQLIRSDAISDEEKRRLQVLLSGLSFRDARLLWKYQGDRTGSDALKFETLGLLDALAQPSNQSALLEGVNSHLSRIYRYRDDLGLSETEVRAIAAEFNEVQDSTIQNTIASILSSVELEPGVEISMQVPTLDGEGDLDVAELRGNIVLIDHWDTNCAPCIAAFPQIHAIYQEYQSQGFEVVSIAYDGNSQRENVKRIKTRMGLTWETLNGEGLWPAIAARYGYTGVPQYMLLDRKGRWIAGTTEMGNGANLRALLDEMLANEKAGYYDRQPAMWRISDDDTTVYLYGTLHSVKNHFNWWSEEAQAALERSSTIYIEVTENTPKDEQQRVLQAYTRNPEGVVLSDFLTKAQETEVRAAADEVGLAWQELSNFTPGFAGNELVSAQLEQDGVEPNKTADSMIVAKAKEHGLELRAFASFERQIRYLAEMSAEGQVAWLMDSLERDDPDSFDRLFQAWYWGDTQALEAEAISGQKEKLPEAYEVLIMGRNSEWAAEIDRVLDEETGSVFVAVGAGHLVGPDSLQSILEKEGHSAVRVH